MSRKDTNLYLTAFTGAATTSRIEAICRRFNVPIYARVLVVGYGNEGRRMQSSEIGWLASRNKAEQMPVKCSVQEGLPTADELRFDYIMLLDVLHNLDDYQREHLLRQALQMLVQGGSLVCDFSLHAKAPGTLVSTKDNMFHIDDVDPHLPRVSSSTATSRLTVEKFERLCRSVGCQVTGRSLWLCRSHRGTKKPTLRIVWPFDRLPGLRNLYSQQALYHLQHR